MQLVGRLLPWQTACCLASIVVWNELLQIPYGQTVTYGEMARRIGCRSAQAVGQAVGRNPVVILVPCHRVVGAHGRLTGYAYGLNRKQQLLQLEKNIIGK